MTDAHGHQADGLRRAAHAPFDAAAQRAPRITVTGAKGGVGKTVVAVNLALLLARAGLRTLLVDLDPGCGNVDVHLRLPRRRGLDDVLAGTCAPAAAVVDGPLGLRVLAGLGSAALGDGSDAATLAQLHAALDAAAADHDVVVQDTGAGLGAATLAAAERADLALAVATIEPSALTDTYALCKLLHQRGCALPRLLVNGARSRDEALRAAGRFGEICRRFLGRDCTLFGWLRRDDELERSTHEQRPAVLGARGPAVAELDALCAAALSALPSLPRRRPRRIDPVDARRTAV